MLVAPVDIKVKGDDHGRQPKVTHGKQGVGHVSSSMRVVDRGGVHGANGSSHREQGKIREANNIT